VTRLIAVLQAAIGLHLVRMRGNATQRKSGSSGVYIAGALDVQGTEDVLFMSDDRLRARTALQSCSGWRWGLGRLDHARVPSRDGSIPWPDFDVLNRSG
jgi:hypothetical protein